MGRQKIRDALYCSMKGEKGRQVTQAKGQDSRRRAAACNRAQICAHRRWRRTGQAAERQQGPCSACKEGREAHLVNGCPDTVMQQLCRIRAVQAGKSGLVYSCRGMQAFAPGQQRRRPCLTQPSTLPLA